MDKPPTAGTGRLNAFAIECHKMAVMRGQLKHWSPLEGYRQIDDKAWGWLSEARRDGNHDGETEQIGDLLHTVLTLARHRDIDPDVALADAIERAKRGRGN